MEKLIFWDLDDVLFDTAGFVRRHMAGYLHDKKIHDSVDKLIDMINNDRTTSFLVEETYLKEIYPETAKELGNRVYEHGLFKGNFIPLVTPDFVLRSFIKDILIPQGYQMCVCTHRKSLDNDGSLTIASLVEHFPDVYFKHVYVINKDEHPNKIKFLNQKHKNFLLVDDNPIHLPVVLPEIPNLIIWNKAHRFAHYINQRRASDVIKLARHINECFLPSLENTHENKLN